MLKHWNGIENACRSPDVCVAVFGAGLSKLCDAEFWYPVRHLKWLKGFQPFSCRSIRNLKKNIWTVYGYIHYFIHTPWSRVLLEKLTGLQLVKKFPAFHGTRRFITALTSACYLLPTYLLTHVLTSWSRVLLEKLTGLQLVKKFPAFYGTRRFITALTSTCYLLPTYLLTHVLTPWSTVLLDKLTGLQLVKKFPAFHGTRRFITAFTDAHHVSLSWARSIQSILPYPTSRRSILILSQFFS